MALQTDFTRDVFGQSMTFKECYFRVTRIVDYNKEEGCTFDVNIYRNKAMSDNRGEPVYSFGYRFPFNKENTKNVIEECYAHLKTLNEFKASIDC